MDLRPFTEADWPAFEPIFREVVDAGETYALSVEEEPRDFWSGEHVVVAVEGDVLLGSAKMGPNRPSQGAHVGTASFMVGSSARGRGIGRALAEYTVMASRQRLPGYPVQRGRRVQRSSRRPVAVARLRDHRHRARGVRSTRWDVRRASRHVLGVVASKQASNDAQCDSKPWRADANHHQPRR